MIEYIVAFVRTKILPPLLLYAIAAFITGLYNPFEWDIFGKLVFVVTVPLAYLVDLCLRETWP